MSRTIADLTAGALVYVDEIISGETVHTPYIYLGLDDNGNARLLRQYAVLAKRMHSSNVASYAGCEMDLWLEDTNDGFLARFDAATINAMVQTAIKYVDCNQSPDGTAQVLQISRRCFLLSYSEEGYGDDPAGNEGSSFLPALKAFYLSRHPGESTVSDNNARITKQKNETAVSAWMRSAFSASLFRGVNTSGLANGNTATSANYWPRPALSVAPATIVSDEGADAIFLLPDGRRTTWNVEAKMAVGESALRPTHAKVALDADGMTDVTVQVCNNYGDASPAWVTVTDGEAATLTNTVKETTNWEIGVRIVAVSGTNLGYVGEPIVTIITEQEV